MKKCECGEPLEDDWDVCPACGKQFEKKVICKGCGRELKPNWKLCPKCKTPIENFNNLIEKRNLALVEGGAFDMGSEDEDADDDEKPVHRVRVASFYMSKYQVTQRLWKEVMGTNPSYYKGDNRPVEQVNCYDTIKFCNALSKKDGLECCYHLDGDTHLEDYGKDELDQVECNFSANGYRLPTEAEWEYAARSGLESDNANYRYAGSNNIDEVAWYDENSGDRTHPVGKKRPNELGIYDMSGNVFEWCWDCFDEDYYSSSPQNNPTGTNSGSRRILRGGSFYYYGRVAGRNLDLPDGSDDYYGFRFVRSVE